MVKDFAREPYLSLSHLSFWTTAREYMLAMKCISGRWDSSDADDVKTLIRLLKLEHAKQVLSIVESYYPKSQIPAKASFFIEEVFESDK